jgi:hypothetical protein
MAASREMLMFSEGLFHFAGSGAADKVPQLFGGRWF